MVFLIFQTQCLYKLVYLPVMKLNYQWMLFVLQIMILFIIKNAQMTAILIAIIQLSGLSILIHKNNKLLDGT